MSIKENEMNELKRLVDATFENCNPPEATTKKDVLMCMANVFTALKPVSQ